MKLLQGNRKETMVTNAVPALESLSWHGVAGADLPGRAWTRAWLVAGWRLFSSFFVYSALRIVDAEFGARGFGGI
jgi:hypothetical protein